jgi:hypothetical protein
MSAALSQDVMLFDCVPFSVEHAAWLRELFVFLLWQIKLIWEIVSGRKILIGLWLVG